MTAGFIRRRVAAGSVLAMCAVFPQWAAADPAAPTVPAPAPALVESYSQLDAAWASAPLAFTAADFAQAPARGFGKYVPRGSAVFAPGETMTVYVQPVGYGFTSSDAGLSYDIQASYRLIMPSGQVLAAEDKFASIQGTSRSEDRQAFTSLTFTFEGLPEGAYSLETTFADAASGKQGIITLPFEIKAAK